MICYNCGSVLTNSDYCSHCGMDVSVYKRIVRLSNSYYNAGLTNVRNWVRRFKNDWSTTGRPAHKPAGISMDLLLESLPFAETREYGRKVVSAAALYAYLYDGKLPSETVREIMY